MRSCKRTVSSHPLARGLNCIRKELFQTEYCIPVCHGKRIDVQKRTAQHRYGSGRRAGRGFFAVCTANGGGFLSPSVTLDCHESLKLNVGDLLYTNLYRPMFRIVSDDVCAHDLLFPSYRLEMYVFYQKRRSRRKPRLFHIHTIAPLNAIASPTMRMESCAG